MKKLLSLTAIFITIFILSSCAGSNREFLMEEMQGQGYLDNFEMVEIEEPDGMFIEDEAAEGEEQTEGLIEENLEAELLEQ